jgi:uncharacterized membrane protein HdeD (DUF308 family)
MEPMDLQSFEAQRAARELAQWWWVWLVTGIVWIIAALVVLQFTRASVVTAGIIIGAVFIVSGIEGFLVAQVIGGGWKWLAITFSFILLIGGVMALFNPMVAFLAVADILGFVFALIGMYWILGALATRQEDSLWGLRLVAGIIMIALGFATVAKLLPARAYVLLVLAGIWALLHGITDIIRAFQIRQLGEMTLAASGPTATGPASTPPMTGPTTDGPLPPRSATPPATP